MPVLILRGRNTRAWYRLIADAAARCISGAETALVAAAGHMTIVENPSDTAAAIGTFLERH
jgi:pimeloyl-ACP methyl ester carboxylesterase